MFKSRDGNQLSQPDLACVKSKSRKTSPPAASSGFSFKYSDSGDVDQVAAVLFKENTTRVITQQDTRGSTAERTITFEGGFVVMATSSA